MVLAGDVFNLDGQILFAKGVELEERHIEILQMWGIPNVDVEDGEDDEERIDLNQFAPHILELAEGIVSQRFKLVKSSHPAVEIVRRLCVQKEAIATRRREASQ